MELDKYINKNIHKGGHKLLNTFLIAVIITYKYTLSGCKGSIALENVNMYML